MTTIRLTDSMTRRKVELRPLDPENVRMYVCGPTVYDRAHLGNARAAVVYDVLFRLLRHVHGPDHVTYVRNLTDIDDKIIARARETGRTVEEVSDETIRWYHEDMDALGCLRPTHEPRATEFVPQMVAMIQTLIARGHAYEAEGHVLFSVSSYGEYGALSGRSVEDMIAGARVEVAPYKRDPMDFVLWKPSTWDQPGWDSPWGRGRPGWHIECSAMARELLGGAFDVHGGGQDLKFPHHENEIAQSRCAHPDEGFAGIWMHNEMLTVDGKKMSKSLGNFTTVRDLLDRGVPGEVIRLTLLGTHYGRPLDWTEERVKIAKGHLSAWYSRIFHRFEIESDVAQVVDDAEFLQALSDDLNVPWAFSRVLRLATDVALHGIGGLEIDRFRTALNVLGLEVKSPNRLEIKQSLQRNALDRGGAQRDVIDGLLRVRADAKAARDFSRADAIRNALHDAGVIIRDTPEGAKWEPSPTFDPAKLEAIR